jgi:hypothetical protein
MTRTARRLLVVLAVVAIGGAAFVMLRQPATDGGAGTNAPASANSQAARPGNPVADLKLESLEQREGTWSAPERDVFRFQSRRESAAPVAPPPPAPTNLSAQTAPSLPPPPPPIPLRYIGYLDQAGGIPRVAVLSDGRGNVFNGKEGDIIEGQYRVLRVGTDSADLIYVDGRGRQTIRLSGQ